MSKLEEETWNPKYLLKDKVTLLRVEKIYIQFANKSITLPKL